MKRFIVAWISIVAPVLSSCTVFILNDDEQTRKDPKDTVSITIIHDWEMTKAETH